MFRALLLFTACLLVFYFASLLLSPHDASRYSVTGIDVSHHQGLIDWRELETAGHDFVFIKATEGRTLRDKAFLHNWTAAGKLGLRRGAYHFFLPYLSAEEQTTTFFRTVDLRPGDFPPVLDVEEIGSLTPDQLVKAIREWSDLARWKYGARPIIYTGQNFYNRYLAGRLDDHYLWLARYDRDRPVTVCGRPYQFWQYSDRGHSHGIKGRVDRNVFTGTALEWASIALPFPDDGPIYPDELEEVQISERGGRLRGEPALE